jgi:hypothetical protein
MFHRHRIYTVQTILWLELFVYGGKLPLAKGMGSDFRDNETDGLKKTIGVQLLVIDAFKKSFKEYQNDSY